MRIILLRHEDDNEDKYKQTFESHGYPEVTQIPALSFTFCNEEELRNCCRNFQQYSGVIFTSKRAIDAFAACADSKTLECMKNQGYLVYVVGPACGDRVRELGLSPEGEDTGNAENLASLIISKQERHSSGPLLFPCGNLARETLPKRLEMAGVGVEGICCYATVANTALRVAFSDYLAHCGVPHVLVFFSPSSVDFHLDTIEHALAEVREANQQHGPHNESCKFVCIGRTTEAAFLRLGKAASAVAEKPNPLSLVQAIQSLSLECG